MTPTLREALTEARHFVDEEHRKRLTSYDPRYIAEAADLLGQIDAVLNAGEGPVPSTLAEDEIKKIIREELVDDQHDLINGYRSKMDVLVAGCRAVGYGAPTTTEEAADRFASLVARAIISYLAQRQGADQ
jgi:hypothetical protein